MIIGGEDFSCWSNRDSGGKLWGVLLVFVGAMLLLNSLGLVSWEIWQAIWQYWPVVLVLAGLRAILGNNLGANWLLFLVTIIVFGLVFLLGLKTVESPLLTYVSPRILDIVNTLNELKK